MAHHVTRPFMSLLTVAAVAALGVACTDADAADEPSTVTVRAVDFGFEGLPDSVSAGTAFELVNTSSSELHELVAIRLPDDEDRAVAELVTLPPEQLAALFPLVETVLLTPPGQESEQIAAVGDGTLTESGRYAIICAIPTGADPAEYLAAAAESDDGPPEVDGGPPHLVHGMWGEVTVTE